MSDRAPAPSSTLSHPAIDQAVRQGICRATPAAIRAAAAHLQDGGLVAFPTETVYGIGADATQDGAVAAVFAVKDRPTFNPLIVHVSDLAAAERLVVMDARARALAARFWPGPLTLVLPRRRDSGLSWLASAGLDTVAVRAPDHPVAQDLLAACQCPLAAPSANRSGTVSPTTAEHVVEDLGEALGMVLDGGPCRIGVESTVIDLVGGPPLILRPGGIPAEDLEMVAGPLDTADRSAGAGEGTPRSPGMLTRHYAPAKPLRMNATRAAPGEAFLGFGPDPDKRATLNLSPGADVREAAANLFAMVRALDRGTWTAIAVAPVPDRGLGRAINDRLRRAAAAAGGSSPAQEPVRGADDWCDRGPAAPCALPGLDEDE